MTEFDPLSRSAIAGSLQSADGDAGNLRMVRLAICWEHHSCCCCSAMTRMELRKSFCWLSWSEPTLSASKPWETIAEDLVGVLEHLASLLASPSRRHHQRPQQARSAAAPEQTRSMCYFWRCQRSPGAFGLCCDKTICNVLRSPGYFVVLHFTV
jgi:hypothetical protein